jgi:C4-type Zn-finger protein
MSKRTVTKVNGEKQTIGHCPSCGQKTVLHGGDVNVRHGVKVWKTKCACGESWRLTPLAWYKAAFIGGEA